MSNPTSRPLSNLFQGAIDLLVHYGLRLLPVAAVSAIGAWIGRRFGPRKREADRRLRRNLNLLRPDIADPDAFEATVRRHWENAGRCYAEFSALTRLYGSGRIRIEGLEHLIAARADGRPQIWIFLHLGNWEVIGPMLVDLGFADNGLQIYQSPLSAVRRRLADRVRRRYADHLIAPGPGSTARIVRTLKAGGVLSIAVDECVAGDVRAPAFGRPMRLDGNLARAARLAARTGARILIVYAARRPSAHFSIRVSPPAPIDLAAMTADRLPEAVAQLNRMIEPIILENIDQWFWLDNLVLDDPGETVVAS
jgi:KDO2-lipid IV(A) lauroyltransferase